MRKELNSRKQPLVRLCQIQGKLEVESPLDSALGVEYPHTPMHLEG